MNIWYNIKNLLGFYRTNIRTIKVIQEDGVEYTFDIDKTMLKEEISNLSNKVKKIKIL